MARFIKVREMTGKFIDIFNKAYLLLPEFSPDVKNAAVKILPYLAVIFGLLMVIASIVEILGTPFISIFAFGKSTLIQTLLLTNVLGIVQGVLMVSAFSALRRKSQKGWRLLFWSQILWIISSFISLSLSLILGFLFLYPLFKVRSEYSK